MFSSKYKLFCTGVVIPAFFITALFSCGVKSSYYQKQTAIPNASWAYNFQPEFRIDISDTSKQYKMYLLLRHDEAYPYANIWFRFKIKAPGDSTFHTGQRIEKSLADIEGKWLGKGLGEIWEHKLPLTIKEMPELNKKGTYILKIEQIMRSNPLPSVLNVGLIIEQ